MRLPKSSGLFLRRFAALRPSRYPAKKDGGLWMSPSEFSRKSPPIAGTGLPTARSARATKPARRSSAVLTGSQNDPPSSAAEQASGSLRRHIDIHLQRSLVLDEQPHHLAVIV